MAEKVSGDKSSLRKVSVDVRTWESRQREKFPDKGNYTEGIGRSTEVRARG